MQSSPTRRDWSGRPSHASLTPHQIIQLGPVWIQLERWVGLNDELQLFGAPGEHLPTAAYSSLQMYRVEILNANQTNDRAVLSDIAPHMQR